MFIDTKIFVINQNISAQISGIHDVLVALMDTMSNPIWKGMYHGTELGQKGIKSFFEKDSSPRKCRREDTQF